MSSSIDYPGCRTDADGPCMLATSSQDACSSEFGEPSFFQAQYCMCTNGYYSRSSQCWNDCYGYGDTTTDLVSLSRESRFVELDCESYSLAIESQADFDNSVSAASESRESTATAASSDDLSNSTMSTTIGLIGDASQGATPSSGAPQTTTWVERPSVAAATQSTSTGSTFRVGPKYSTLRIMTVLTILCAFSLV